MVHGAGFRVQGSGCRDQGAGGRVQGAEFRVQCAGYRAQGSGCRVLDAGLRVQDAGCRVQGAGVASEPPARKKAYAFTCVGISYLTQCINSMVLESQPSPKIENLLVTITDENNNLTILWGS